MLPFLLIQTRAEDLVAADELRSTTELGGFAPGQLATLRLDRELAATHSADTAAVPDGGGATGPDGGGAAPVYDWATMIEQHSGIILGGSPYNASDPDETKDALQLRVETELGHLLDVVVERDVPFLGLCYGTGTLGRHRGGVVDRRFGEPAGVVTVSLTEQGRADPLLAGMPETFTAYMGHKEAVSELPDDAVLLVTGEACPVQMFRVGQNVYATQFHPEEDMEGLLFRLGVYADRGYYDVATADELFTAIRDAEVTETQKILATFVTRYARH